MTQLRQPGAAHLYYTWLAEEEWDFVDGLKQTRRRDPWGVGTPGVFF
nr:hypothetical protein [Synechococcus sp. UW106]